jgi:hypothetical protein
MNKFFKEILSNPEPDNSYSMTKFAVLVGLCLWVAQIISTIWIMVVTKNIDQVVIGEVLAFVLTLLGYRTSFGFAKSNTTSKIITTDDSGNKTITDTTSTAQNNPKEEL